MQVSANGVTFNCQIDGPEGAPWITFSNSLATDISMWDDQVAALQGEYRCLRYDKRGHGGSEPVEGPYSFDMLADDVIAIWDALDIATSHFVGLSIGGMTAMGLGAAHGDRLDKVVIANSRADAPPEFRAAWDQRIATAEETGMAAMADPTVERWCSDSFHASGSPTLDKMRAMVSSTSLAGFVGCARALQGLDYEKVLGDIAVPTLFIGGADDTATPADNMRRIQAMVANSRFVEIAPAGHLSAMEQPAAFTEAVSGFLAGG